MRKDVARTRRPACGRRRPAAGALLAGGVERPVTARGSATPRRRGSVGDDTAPSGPTPRRRALHPYAPGRDPARCRRAARDPAIPERRRGPGPCPAGGCPRVVLRRPPMGELAEAMPRAARCTVAPTPSRAYPRLPVGKRRYRRQARSLRQRVREHLAKSGPSERQASRTRDSFEYWEREIRAFEKGIARAQRRSERKR